ncbi:MAG TPA: peptidoglycan-binding protein [Candidatus Nitrosotalea sp.]|nr:peptidoglycan-binding protein [Candidatus Nitrosotalea sp.]
MPMPKKKTRKSPRPVLFGVAAAVCLVVSWWLWPHQKEHRVAGSKEAPRSRVSETRATNPPPATTSATQPAPSPTVRVDVNRGPDSSTTPLNAPRPTEAYPRPARGLIEIQLALARLGLSPGSMDGASGSRTRAAVQAFQLREKLPVTGDLDSLTRSKLLLTEPAVTNYVVTSNDLARLRPLGKTWLEKSRQDRMDYESILELVSEFSESNPALVRLLNPGINWTNVTVNTILVIPNVPRSAPPEKAAFAQIELEHRALEVFDRNTNLLAHFPCSIAKFADKRPVGELHVAILAPNPNYTFDPDNFPESAEARRIDRKLILQPGPNNPVGTVWIGLDRPGYGIHGTPSPDLVGRAESHGCFRLANWNAEYFLQMAWVGMPIYVEP